MENLEALQEAFENLDPTCITLIPQVDPVHVISLVATALHVRIRFLDFIVPIFDNFPDLIREYIKYIESQTFISNVTNFLLLRRLYDSQLVDIETIIHLLTCT